MSTPTSRYDRTFTETAGLGNSGVDASVMAVSDRGAFITQTYIHLFGAILAFVGIEVALFRTGAAESITQFVAGTSWLIVLGAFMVVSWLATRFANKSASPAAQYLGLAAFVAAEAIIFVPLLYIADKFAPGAIQSAAICTMLGFAGLTAVAFGTRADFSFLRGILIWAGISAVVLIVASVIFGFNLGTIFSVAMVAVAGASILYDTSNVIHHYPRDRYVAASLQLFASVALMFWYILRIFLAARR